MATEQRSTNLSPITCRLAMRSCQSCKVRKRRCTREMPKCRLCVRGRRSCLYPSVPYTENQQIQASQVEPVTAVSKQVLRNNLSVTLFLDQTLFHSCAPMATPHYHVPIPPGVDHVLGDVDNQKAVAAEYFRTAHHWMPIVSRVRFYGSLMNPMREADPSLIVLLLGMKLILSCPDQADLRSDIYTITKEFQLRMEMAGYLSIYVLQSMILTTLYEIGHAIYPGAFTTVSTSARQAIALGITGTLPVQGKAWFEQEERNRTWWAIIILDRLVNLSFRGSHLCTPDPSVSSILPIDDDAWDQGILPDNQSPTLLSTPCMKDGRYARLAQAAHLLSQVYHHISSHKEALRLDLDNIAQLERTLLALGRLSSIEEREKRVCCFCSVASCHSAILLLRTTYLSELPENLTEEGKEESYQSIQAVSAKTIQIIEAFQAGERGGVENIPPLALDWLYRPAVAHIFLAHNTLSLEWNWAILQLKKALEGIDQRWRAASE